jgi:cytochrome c oxidase cbb3-type subunit 3/ubiquinol-cytochrome c reductase cytochrome c subunit
MRYCALCHGDEAEGGAADHAPALGNDSFLRLAGDRFLAESIRRGHPGTPMSAFGEAVGGPLSDTQIDELVAYLRAYQLGPSRPEAESTEQLEVAPARAQRGARLFAGGCASCHGAQGEGRLAPSLHNPVFLELVSDAFLRRTITDGRPGTAMAAFGQTLAPEQIDDLIHFIRSLRAQSTPSGTTQAGEAETWRERTGDELVLHPEGRAPRFAPANTYVAAADVKLALEQERRMILFDARAVPDWRAAHLPGALPAPYYSDAEDLARVPNDGTQIVVYCGCPHAAADRLAARLRQAGHERVAVIEEGFFHWQEQGYPLVHEPQEGHAE